MKNKELFERTVSILVKSYQDDTLEYTDCSACAVGNIVAANNGIQLKKLPNGEINAIGGKSDLWKYCFQSFGDGVKGLSSYMPLDGKQQIATTGYSINEIAEIEKSFHTGYAMNLDNFEGLMSLIDCLMVIHEANEVEVLQAKSLFIKETA